MGDTINSKTKGWYGILGFAMSVHFLLDVVDHCQYPCWKK